MNDNYDHVCCCSNPYYGYCRGNGIVRVRSRGGKYNPKPPKNVEWLKLSSKARKKTKNKR